jgi:cytochrome c-type biogenesis protein CcmH
LETDFAGRNLASASLRDKASLTRRTASSIAAAMAKRSGRLILLLFLLGWPLAAQAVQPDEVLSDPQLETRARALSRELRCMVCQNQSIDDSEAPLARDLRVLVRERLRAGDSDSQVLDFLVARYGAFVLLRPPFEWHTALLWLAPLAVLLAGGLSLVFLARKRRPPAVPPALSAAEQERLAQLTGPHPRSGD